MSESVVSAGVTNGRIKPSQVTRFACVLYSFALFSRLYLLLVNLIISPLAYVHVCVVRFTAKDGSVAAKHSSCDSVLLGYTYENVRISGLVVLFSCYKSLLHIRC